MYSFFSKEESWLLLDLTREKLNVINEREKVLSSWHRPLSTSEVQDRMKLQRIEMELMKSTAGT